MPFIFVLGDTAKKSDLHPNTAARSMSMNARRADEDCSLPSSN